MDIETDFNQFYLKFVKNSDTIVDSFAFKNLQFEMRSVRHFWRNRIDFNTSKIKKDISSWDHILHNRIANYFKMYTQILNYSTFILVSHKNMISVYDNTNHGEENDWIDTIILKEGNIRHMSIKRRLKDKF